MNDDQAITSSYCGLPLALYATIIVWTTYEIIKYLRGKKPIDFVIACVVLINSMKRFVYSLYKN